MARKKANAGLCLLGLWLLLLLSIVPFAPVYYQRQNRKKYTNHERAA